MQSKRQKVPNQLCMENSKLTKVGNRWFNISWQRPSIIDSQIVNVQTTAFFSLLEKVIIGINSLLHFTNMTFSQIFDTLFL